MGKKNIIYTFLLFFAATSTFFLFPQRYENMRKIMSNPTSSILEKIYLKSRLVCFGRYALEVPYEAELITGSVSVPDKIDLIDGGVDAYDSIIKKEIAKIKKNDDTAEIQYSGEGPVRDSWQIRYYEDKYAKDDGVLYFSTFVNKGEFSFVLGDAVNPREDLDIVIGRQDALAKSLKIFNSNEIPTEPGFCINNGFVANNLYGRQEMVSAGIYIPSFPDITFSVSSNKNAYSDYSLREFEKLKIEELPLLARIKQAQEIQGEQYPDRTVLREGKRRVQHWQGEESLFKRADGTHDFEWAFVGTPKDVANPSEYRVKMFTKVAYNTVGAAEKSSLTDEEAVALWDRLLSGLKFRVKVPGAPEGSYYFLPGASIESGTKP
jgi:hypothetical protein